RPLGHERCLLLLVVEQLIDLVRLDGLLPKDIAGMVHLFIEAAGGMTIEDRSAKSDVFAGIAVGSKRHVPAGHDKFKFLAPWFAEDGNALFVTPLFAAGVILKLLKEVLVPIRIDHAFEDIVNDRLLLLGKELASNMGFRDLPIVGDKGAEEA